MAITKNPRKPDGPSKVDPGLPSEGGRDRQGPGTPTQGNPNRRNPGEPQNPGPAPKPGKSK